MSDWELLFKSEIMLENAQYRIQQSQYNSLRWWASVMKSPHYVPLTGFCFCLVSLSLSVRASKSMEESDVSLGLHLQEHSASLPISPSLPWGGGSERAVGEVTLRWGTQVQGCEAYLVQICVMKAREWL